MKMQPTVAKTRQKHPLLANPWQISAPLLGVFEFWIHGPDPRFAAVAAAVGQLLSPYSEIGAVWS
jgi:hypothetical protein